MSNQVQLFSQAELTDLNVQLDQIKKNLNAHVNGSLSKVHGINVVQIPYFDSGGDKVGDWQLAFHFGVPPSTYTLLVPARVVTGAADPGPHSTSDGSIISGGSGALSGVPILPKALVTTSPSAEALSQASVYNQLLLAHSNMTVNDERELQIHGGITHAASTVLDALGHVVSTEGIFIGVNGRSMKMLAVPEITKSDGGGAAEAPRGAKLYVKKVVKSDGTDDWRNRVHHKAPNKKSGAILLVAPTTGSDYDIIWQANAADKVQWPGKNNPYALSATWDDLNPTGEGNISGDCLHGFTPTTFLVASDKMSLALETTHGGDHPIQFIRVKLQNDAGTFYTNVCLFSASDTDSGPGIFDIILTGGAALIFGSTDNAGRTCTYEERLPGASTLWD